MDVAVNSLQGQTVKSSETGGKKSATSQTLQALVNTLNVNVHYSTIRKRLNKYGLFERRQEKSLLSKKNVAPQQGLEKLLAQRPLDRGDQNRDVLPEHTNQNSALALTPRTNCQHGGGGLMIGAWFYNLHFKICLH